MAWAVDSAAELALDAAAERVRAESAWVFLPSRMEWVGAEPELAVLAVPAVVRGEV